MRPGPVLALVAAVAAAPSAPAAELLGSHAWDPGFEGAGGFSALWLDADGEGFVALSDRGSWVRGRLGRGPDGAIAGAAVEERGPLLRGYGGPLRGGERDAESIAWAGGAFWIGFEGDPARGEARVARYDDLAARPKIVAPPPGLARLGRNLGLEALAAGSDGTLWAIPEAPPAGERDLPVWRFRDGAWTRAFALARSGGWRATGADIGPDGRLYVLERRFGLLGFGTRVRSMALHGGDLRVELETPLGLHDNLEGLAVTRDREGRLRATMISDDNLRPLLQTTEFVEYLLD